MIIVWPSSPADLLTPAGGPIGQPAQVATFESLAGSLTATGDIYQVYESALSGPNATTNVETAQVYESALSGPNANTDVRAVQVYISVLCTVGNPPPPPPPPIPFECWPTPETFNPPLAKTIPSYLYVQYNDDDALQAFVTAYNKLTQQFIDTFNNLNLPIYIKQSGDLLDWVAAGLYGFPQRPTLVSGTLPIYGAYNTQAYNTGLYNDYVVGGSLVYTPVSDDVFRRIITWHFYKADGTNFSIPWLKRRIARFLFAGPDCLLPNIGPTDQISISFGNGNIVYIDLIETVYRYNDDAIYDTFAYNTMPYSGDSVVVTRLPPIALAQIFKDCVNGGFLELPAQFQFIVRIIG